MLKKAELFFNSFVCNFFNKNCDLDTHSWKNISHRDILGHHNKYLLFCFIARQENLDFVFFWSQRGNYAVFRPSVPPLSVAWEGMLHVRFSSCKLQNGFFYTILCFKSFMRLDIFGVCYNTKYIYLEIFLRYLKKEHVCVMT